MLKKGRIGVPSFVEGFLAGIQNRAINLLLPIAIITSQISQNGQKYNESPD
jgi:hypothetical protein